MTREEHEALLAELLSPDLDQPRKTEILQELRVRDTNLSADVESLTTSKAKLKTDYDGMVVANSQLFRKLGTVNDDEETTKEEEKKTFSETVTISDMEKNLNL